MAALKLFVRRGEVKKSIVVLILLSSMYLIEEINPIGNVLIGVSILIVFLMSLMINKISYKRNKNVVYLYIANIISLFSVIKTKDPYLFFNFFLLLILMITSVYLVPSHNINIKKTVYRSTLIAHIPLIIIPIILNGISVLPYKGIFYNPNSFGNVAVTLFATILAVYTSDLETKQESNLTNKKNTVWFPIILLFLMFLIILSGSRSSFVVMVILSFVSIMILNKNILKQGTYRFIFSTLLFLFFLFLIFKYTIVGDYLYERIIFKFIVKSSRGDVLDSRGIVWRETLLKSSLLGNGTSFFSHTTIAPHSTYFSILGRQGWIVFVLFLIVLFNIFRTTIRFSVNSNDRYCHLPLYITLTFILLSVVEVMMFKLSMISMILLYGGSLENDKYFKG